MTKDGATYYLGYDQVGTLKVVADASGSVIKKVDYDTFGNILNDMNPAFAVPFGFAGGLHDSDTGLVRFGYRDYDPETGRWTAKDPILFAGGDTDLYGYCVNDPVNLIDPDGEIAVPVIVGGGVLIAGAVIHIIQQNPPKIPPRPVPDYEGNKQKRKKYSQPSETPYGGPCEEAKGPGNDQCKEMEKVIYSDSFKSLPLHVRWLYRAMYYFSCNDIG